MKNGKYVSKKGMNKKPLALLLALTLLVTGVVGGTIAWLTAESDDVVNTFTVGDINISIKETDVDNDGDSAPNVTDPEVTWFIAIEPMGDSNKTLYFMEENDEPIVIRDTLPEGFTLKSIKLKNQNNEEQDVIEHTPSEYDDYYGAPNLFYYQNGQQLVVNIGKGKNIDGYGLLKGGTYLEIVTEYEDYENLAPGKKTDPFTNTANITVNGTQYSDVTAQVTITPPALISKSITYRREEAPKPKFTVEVNPNGQNLLTGETITVKDVIMDTNQTFLADTLVIYEGVGSSKSSTPVNKTSYSVSVNDAKTEFTITGLKDQQAYTIEYRTRVNVAYDYAEKFDLINRVYLDGVLRDMNNDGKVDADEYAYETQTV